MKPNRVMLLILLIPLLAFIVIGGVSLGNTSSRWLPLDSLFGEWRAESQEHPAVLRLNADGTVEAVEFPRALLDIGDTHLTADPIDWDDTVDADGTWTRYRDGVSVDLFVDHGSFNLYMELGGPFWRPELDRQYGDIERVYTLSFVKVQAE